MRDTPHDDTPQRPSPEGAARAPADAARPRGEARRLQRHASRTGSTHAAFMKEVCAATGLPRERAEWATVSCVGALLRRIQPAEARQLLAQLPAALRAALPPEDVERTQRFGAADLVESVAVDLGVEPAEAGRVARAVLRVVHDHVSAGEADQVSANLPDDLRALWEGRH